MYSVKKKIALVMTGGTISTVLSGGVMRTENDVAAEFSQYGFVKIIEPIKILSENLGFNEINAICGAVRAAVSDNAIDAIVLTHGTDSLAYSAAALSLMLYDLEKPIVFVSADYPLSDLRSNGNANMSAAVDFINSTDFGGVFVAYKNICEAFTQIHFGARLNYTRGFDGYVSSALNRICGTVENGIFTLIEKPNCIQDAQKVKLLPTLKASDEGKVLLIQPYPGLCYKTLAKMQKAYGFEIVHDSYHSGTVKTDGDNHIGLLKGSVLIAGGISGDKYESVLKLIANGNVKFIDNITPAALYFKRVLSLRIIEKERESYLNQNIANEYF